MFNLYESQMERSIEVQLHADTISDKVKRFISNTGVSAEEAGIVAIIGVVISACVYASATFPF